MLISTVTCSLRIHIKVLAASCCCCSQSFCQLPLPPSPLSSYCFVSIIIIIIIFIFFSLRPGGRDLVQRPQFYFPLFHLPKLAMGRSEYNSDLVPQACCLHYAHSSLGKYPLAQLHALYSHSPFPSSRQRECVRLIAITAESG